MNPRRALAQLLRLFLAGVLLYAAVAKWPAPRAFAEDIANYRLLPAALVPAATAAMLGVETLLGLALAANLLLRPWRREVALATALLMALFTAAVGSALARGLKIECGCFGAGQSPATMLTLWRDVGFLAAAAVLTALDSRRPAS